VHADEALDCFLRTNMDLLVLATSWDRGRKALRRLENILKTRVIRLVQSPIDQCPNICNALILATHKGLGDQPRRGLFDFFVGR